MIWPTMKHSIHAAYDAVTDRYQVSMWHTLSPRGEQISATFFLSRESMEQLSKEVDHALHAGASKESN